MNWFRPALVSLLCLAAAIAPAAAQPVHSQEQEPEMVLPACGIRYPGGYDPNTVGVVEGSVAALTRPERGPVTFRLDASGEVYTVLAAPGWYWEELKPAVRDGARVRVKGSKTLGADGNLYLVAQEIVPADAGETLILRDARGKPRWSGCGPRGCGGRGR
jgi:hypothetical protein